MKKKYEFIIATNRLHSQVKNIKEFEFNDDSTEDEILEKVKKSYLEWLLIVNQGGYKEIK